VANNDDDDDNVIKGKFPKGADSATGHRNQRHHYDNRLRIAVYPYVDKNGHLVSRVCRHEWEDEKGEKQKGLPIDSLLEPIPPPWKAEDDSLPWIPKAPPLPLRPLYRLKELLDAPLDDVIMFPEGEKDADTCVRLGFTATSVMGGADNWWGTYALAFEGRRVYVLIDNDDKGRIRGELVRRMLSRVAESVQVIMPQGVGNKGDITDWTINNPSAVRKDVMKMVNSNENWVPPFDRKKDETLNDELQKIIVAVRRREGWKDLVKRTKVMRSPLNAGKALDLLEIGVRFDEFNNKVLLNNTGRDVYDTFMIDEVTLWIVKRIALIWETAFSQNMIRAEIAERAVHAHFSPVRDWFNGLNWDNTKRLDSWLITYLGAEDTPLNRAYGRKWLMAGVRRIMSPKVNQSISPGVKFDYMLVLEGPQGIGKSTALRILAGDEWFTDRLSFKVIDDQRKIIEVITGKLIVEMSELAGLPIREVEDVKNFLSRTHDTARLAYRREPEELARTAIFAGTTNSKFYLHDSENRRFWCVGCGELNLVQLAKDREQLWAEAVAAAYTDESLELPKELWEEANEVTEQRKIEDPRLEVWSAKLKGLVDDTTKQIMNQEVEVYVVDWPTIYNRVGLDDRINVTGHSYIGKLLRQIMAQLGWQRRKFTGGKRLFWRKDKDDPYEF